MNDNAIVPVSSGGGFIAPVADLQTALRRYQAVKDFIKSVLVEGVDFGNVPGSTKPSLLKPGAEKMTSFFGFTVRTILADSVEDWTGEQHNGEPFFYYRYRVQLLRGEALVAEGEGSANSWESKYRYRKSERTCPVCGKDTIIKGKADYGGGWLCFAKKGGCGAKFDDNDPQIIEQQTGRVKNPDPADIVNTLQKMGQKRALVAPVLIATNTSEYFTQDIEDYIDGSFTEAVKEPAVVVTNPNPEHKPTRQPAQAPKSPVQVLVDAGLSENTAAAASLLNKSKWGAKDPAELIRLATIYRAWRNAGADVDAAIENANAGATLPE